MLGLFAVMLALQAGPDARPDPRPTIVERLSPSALRDSLGAAQLRFFFDWSQVWRASAYRPTNVGTSTVTGRLRFQHLHCHPDAAGTTAYNTRVSSMIRSSSSWYAVCPTWYIASDSTEERSGIDAGLSASYRPAVRNARASLIDFFDAASTFLPRDDWILGQLVRLRVDQGDFRGALDDTEACAADRWWCAALRGYVFSAMGNSFAAESVFVALPARQTAAERCRWTDLSELLDITARTTYRAMTCPQRDSVNTRLWWLSDPMWTEPGNPRFVEQNVRRVHVALRRDAGRDERIDWRDEAGGDALEQMVRRYGWPSYLYWGGFQQDRSHSTYLKSHETALNEPYTTFEYSPGRLHLVPAWSAISYPLTARFDDWGIGPPIGTSEFETADAVWWPREHFAPSRPLVQLPEGQTVFLRRDSHVIVAAAFDLDFSHVRRPRGDSIAATLLTSDSVDRFEAIGGGWGAVGTPLVVRGDLTPRQTLLGVEYSATSTRPGGRTRYSIAPPSTLASIAPGETAISEPVILRAPSDDRPLPNDPEHALAFMAGSTRISGTRQLGVYWETYGFLPGDTVDVAVWIERSTPQSVMRRLGNALRITTDLNTPVVTTWKEPQLARTTAHRIASTVPIIARSIVLDISQLAVGDYWLDIAVGRPGQPPIRSRKSFVIR